MSFLSIHPSPFSEVIRVDAMYFSDVDQVYHSRSTDSLLDGRSSGETKAINDSAITLPGYRELDYMINNTERVIKTTDNVENKWLSSIKQNVSFDNNCTNLKYSKKRKLRKTKTYRPPRYGSTYCHSCNSCETPEWRKGPLGPRTLCNACGLSNEHLRLLRK
ncbi:hypothetical protein BDB01DRAFT_768478 [Pilobolus umbonatus]|nr:hypothetical protein BDB01DRAFT_768478 [Pilobolus umbonatus]